jgi:hypothetical protein
MSAAPRPALKLADTPPTLRNALRGVGLRVPRGEESPEWHAPDHVGDRPWTAAETAARGAEVLASLREKAARTLVKDCLAGGILLSLVETEQWGTVIHAGPAWMLTEGLEGAIQRFAPELVELLEETT